MNFEFRSEITMLTEARGSPCRSHKMSISIATTTTDTEPYHFSWFCEIMEEYVTFFFVNQRSDGKFHDFVFSISAMHQLYSATFTIVCGHFFYIAKIRESVDIWVSNNDEITPSPTITSKWPTFCNACFTSPRDDTISSVSGSKSNIYAIYKHFDLFKIIE